MRGLRWLGAVLSLLWFAGLGGWLWMSSVGDRDEWYALQLQRCYSNSNANREKLQTDDGQYNQKIADISSEYYSCTERVRTIFDTQMHAIRTRVLKIMAVNAGALAAIWLLVWITIIVRRWNAASFH
jgi:hypothetical protein